MIRIEKPPEGNFRCLSTRHDGRITVSDISCGNGSHFIAGSDDTATYFNVNKLTIFFKTSSLRKRHHFQCCVAD